MGRFQPGQSGNPSGRPRGAAGLAAKIKELVGEEGERLVAAALKILLDERSKASDKLAALQWLGDRAFGRAPTTVDLNVASAEPAAPTMDLSRLSVEELRQLEALYARAALPPADGQVIDVTPTGPTPEEPSEG